MYVSKVKKILNLLIKILILGASYFYIYYQFTVRDELAESWNYFSGIILSRSFITGFALVILMMLLNWALEAQKWRFLISKTENISFFSAYKAIWAGITASTFTPNRTGEYIGRVFILKETHPWQGVFMTIVGSLSQLLITLVAGSVAAIWFVYSFVDYQHYFSLNIFIIIAIAVLLADIALISIFFNVRYFENLLKRLTLKRWEKLRNHLKIFGAYSRKELLVVLLFSLGRYLVFITQFYILLRMFEVPIPVTDGFLIISLIYFLMTGVPTVAFTELGVRGSLSVFLMEAYFSGNYLADDSVIFGTIAAAALVWIINLVIPAIAGGIFVFQLRFFRK